MTKSVPTTLEADAREKGSMKKKIKFCCDHNEQLEDEHAVLNERELASTTLVVKCSFLLTLTHISKKITRTPGMTGAELALLNSNCRSTS